MIKKDSKTRPDKVQRGKGKEQRKGNDERDRDFESGDNPEERRNMTGQ